jgi:hypothetical protein
MLPLTLASGCASTPEVTPPLPDATDATVCDDLMAALPEAVQQQAQHTVEPSSPYSTAWGDPAIVLRCGVGRPATYEQTAELATVNGVNWFPEQLDNGYRFTSWGRQAIVEVTVPDDYAPEVNPLVDLAPAMKATNPKIDQAYN